MIFRARIMVELHDQTGGLETIMCGKNAEIFLSCSAYTLMNYTFEVS